MTKALTNNQVLIKECIKQEYELDGTFSDESNYFEYFSCSQVLKNHALSSDEIMSGVVGSGNDGGCDGVYVFLNNDLLLPDQLDNLSAQKGSVLNLTILQAKMAMSFGEDAIMKWKTVTGNLLDMSQELESFNGRYSEAVIEHFSLFTKAIAKLIRSNIKLQIQFYYVTLATQDIHPNVTMQAEELKKQLNIQYPSAKIDVYFIGADKLMELYNSDVDVDVSLTFSDSPISLGRNDEYVALVNLATYYKLITDNVGRLQAGFFEANVRDYQGKNSVNSSIADSLASLKIGDFWWLNNGITILAQKASLVTSKELVITNPEIVNGLQTSTEIFNYFSNNQDAINTEQRNVLVRIIVPSNEAIRDSIIFANNNQTNIPKSSLRVTDQIHLQIETFFKTRGLYYDRRKNFYKNQKKKTSDIIGVSFLAQCLISIFLRKPDFARARPSTLLTDNATYRRLYEENPDLDVFYKTAVLGKRVRILLNKSQNITTAEKSDVLFYLLYGVVAKSMNKTQITYGDFKNFDIDSITDDFINEIKEKIYEKYKELGGNGRVAKSSDFVDEIESVLNIDGKGVLQ